MAIRDIFRRVARKSGSTSTTNSQSDTVSEGPTAPTSPTPPARSSKGFSWRTSKPLKKVEEPPHPREQPLTEANLKHQELLNAFTMTFGRRRGSQGGRSSFGGISPGQSRNNSVDASATSSAVSGTNGPRRSLAYELPKVDTVQEEPRT
jgi:hypothetical protein